MTSIEPALSVPPRSAGTATGVVTWTHGDAWDAFVGAASDGTLAHRWAWLRIVEQTYGHPTYPLAAVRAGRLVGVLPLVLVRSRLFGRHLVSMPYLDCGGICSAGDADAKRSLLDAALLMSAQLKAALELRQRTVRPYPLPAATHKVAMTLDLQGGESAVWSRVKSNRRGQVRKAWRNGLDATVTGEDGVPALFAVLATNMRDLGSPVHRRSFFRNTVRELGEDARILLIRHNGAVAGAGLVLTHGDGMVLPFSSAFRATFPLGTNQLLYWEAVRYALTRGCRVFDFGRSSWDSGTYEAKREWAARPEQLYWYGGKRIVESPEAERMSRLEPLTVRAWKRLPVRVATLGGQLIRGGLPQ
jgi:FemAB-related protein (PEP-CTERM system-associated)